MDRIDNQQIDWIRSRLEAKGLGNYPWAEEIIDHFCGYIEARMSPNLNLDQAYCLGPPSHSSFGSCRY